MEHKVDIREASDGNSTRDRKYTNKMKRGKKITQETYGNIAAVAE